MQLTLASSSLPNALRRLPRSLRTQYKSWNTKKEREISIHFWVSFSILKKKKKKKKKSVFLLLIIIIFFLRDFIFKKKKKEEEQLTGLYCNAET